MSTICSTNSTDIRDQLGSLSDSIILAIVLVMIIIVAALGLRSGLLVGAAIPTSFLISFLVLNGMGITLNYMIMFAMLLAVGILVDGADHRGRICRPEDDRGRRAARGLRGSGAAHVLARGQRHRDDDRARSCRCCSGRA